MKLRYLTPLAIGLTLLTAWPAAAQTVPSLADTVATNPLFSGQATGGPVHVDLTEWAITPSTTVVPAA